MHVALPLDVSSVDSPLSSSGSMAFKRAGSKGTGRSAIGATVE